MGINKMSNNIRKINTYNNKLDGSDDNCEIF